MRRGLIGLILLALVAVVAVVLTQTNLGQVLQRGSAPAPVSVAIFYGGEKSALLADPAVQSILTGRYGVTLDATKAGSVEMVTALDISGKDCLWPSNEIAVELAKTSGKTVLAEDTIFNSPIVLYACADVAAALEKAGVVTDRGGILVADTGYSSIWTRSLIELNGEGQTYLRAAGSLGIVDNRSRLVHVTQRIDGQLAPLQLQCRQVHTNAAVAGA